MCTMYRCDALCSRTSLFLFPYTLHFQLGRKQSIDFQFIILAFFFYMVVCWQEW